MRARVSNGRITALRLDVFTRLLSYGYECHTKLNLTCDVSFEIVRVLDTRLQIQTTEADRMIRYVTIANATYADAGSKKPHSVMPPLLS